MSISHISLLPVLPRDRAGSLPSYSHHPRGSCPSRGPQGHTLRTACLSTFPGSPAARHQGTQWGPVFWSPQPHPQRTKGTEAGVGAATSPLCSFSAGSGEEGSQAKPAGDEGGIPKGSSQVLYPWLRWGPPPASGSLLSSLGRAVPRSQSDLLTGPQVGGEVRLVGSAPRSQELGAQRSFVICGASASGNVRPFV